MGSTRLSRLVAASLAPVLIFISPCACAEKLVFCDYFLGLHTPGVTGEGQVWRLYFSHDSAVSWPGSLYDTSDKKLICSTYYPVIGPYDTADPNVAEFHILLAQLSGIDGFLGEWFFPGNTNHDALVIMNEVGKRYGFQIGIHWTNGGLFSWGNDGRPYDTRAEAIAAAQNALAGALRDIYATNGAWVDGHPLVLMFDVQSNMASQPTQGWFDPNDITALRGTADTEGYAPLFLTRNGWWNGDLAGWMDGFFPWVHPTSGPVEAPWTQVGDLATEHWWQGEYAWRAGQYLAQGSISHLMSGAWPGFDDHKGHAWGSGEKRYIPHLDGQMFHEMWDRVEELGEDAVLLQTWNDWEEATMLEPTREFGYRDIDACAQRIWSWKGMTPPSPALIHAPERLLQLRRALDTLSKAGVPEPTLAPVKAQADLAGTQIAAMDETAALAALTAAETAAAEVFAQEISALPVEFEWRADTSNNDMQVTWPFSPTVQETGGKPGYFISPRLDFLLTQDARDALTAGHFAGRLAFEYFDTGTEYQRVLVDAADSKKQVIADFRKKNSGAWRRVELDMVNARFTGGLGNADIRFRNDGGTGWLHWVRIEGMVLTAMAGSKEGQ